jgi:EmrB/QacA subfamily drug resistance transporter
MSIAIHVSCDAAAARAVKAEANPPHPDLILATTICASSLAFIDGSVVNVGLPAIGRELAADAGALQWVINAYLLPLSALLLLGGAAGDRYGRRRLLIFGTSLFALASIGCAVAPGLVGLLGARLMQGASAAVLMPNSLAILGQSFAGESKGRAIGIWAAAGAAAGAIGPVLGGWLIDLGSWRAIFLLNVPIAAGAILLAWRYVPPDADDDGQALDVRGGALATLGLGALTFALTIGSGPSGWTTPAIVSVGVAVALLIAFVAAEKQRGDDATMPLGLFASRGFIGLTLLTLFLYGALGALFVLIPYVLINAAGYVGTAAGAALLPLPLLLAVGSPLMGRLAAKIGPRLPLSIGPLVVAVGFLLAFRIGLSANYWTDVMPAILVIAIGMSGAVAPLTTAVLSSVDARHTGSASGFNSAVARTGGLIATALLGSVLAAQGEQLIASFCVAMLAGALACTAASISAFMLLGENAKNTAGRAAVK